MFSVFEKVFLFFIIWFISYKLFIRDILIVFFIVVYYKIGFGILFMGCNGGISYCK